MTKNSVQKTKSKNHAFAGIFLFLSAFVFSSCITLPLIGYLFFYICKIIAILWQYLIQMNVAYLEYLNTIMPFDCPREGIPFLLCSSMFLTFIFMLFICDRIGNRKN